MKYLRPYYVLAILFLAAGTASSQKLDLKYSRNAPAVLKAFRPVVAQPSEYTVRIRCDGVDAALGAIIESDGYILTKASELYGKITVKTKNGAEHEAKIVGKNDEYDLALLKIDASGLAIVEWRDSKTATVGNWVASPGLGEDPAAIGVVGVSKRKLVNGDQPPKAAMNPNMPFLGVGLANAEDGGAKITDVSPGTPAFKAGLKINDIIFEFSGKPIPDEASLRSAILRQKINDTVLFKVRRGEEELELRAKLIRNPNVLGNKQDFMGSELSKRRGQFPFILQHDSVLKPQDCGGPLVDLDGKTVGINIARAGRTESYAIPSEDVQKLLVDLKSNKFVSNESPVNAKKEFGVLLRANPTLSKKDLASKIRKGSFMKVHEVKMAAGGTYVIEMDSNEVDSYLILENADGKKLAEDDNDGGFPNARIVFRAPTDGTYRIIATTFMPNETGGYSLSVRREK